MKTSAALLIALSVSTASHAGLTLDRVLLSNGGVAYMEYRSEVHGNATLELPIPLEQVDDVLKSLVIFDHGGSVTGVSLPGREPLAQSFRELPFTPADLDSPVSLLNALRGESVQIDKPRHLQGRLLSVEAVNTTLPDRLGTVIQHRISVMSEQGLQQVLLEDSDALRFSDPQLQRQVQQALAAISAYRDQDTRILTVTTIAADDKQRQVRAGYVVAAPLWKASYRLVLEADSDKAHLQGWAHLENLSGQDWDDISLTLASGNPVTFRQALYQAYFVERPQVPVEVSGRVLPGMDSGALSYVDAEEEADEYRRGGKQKRAMPMAEMAMGMMAADSVAAAPAPSAAGFGAASMITANASQDAAEQILFTLPQALSLANGHALMTPIVDRPFPALRLSLYQPGTHAEHPLDSVRVSNNGELALPPGVVTLYGAGGSGSSFLGDARMDGLPTDDSRLLSFALDQKVRIKTEQQQQQTVTGGTISKGLLHLKRRARRVTRYDINPLADRTLWLEQPRINGWELTGPRDALIETTAGQYRLQFTLKAGQPRKIEVTLERPIQETLALNGMARSQLHAFASNSQLSPALRRGFKKLAQLRQTIDDADQQVKNIEQDINRIHRDQQRLRDNMQRLNQRSDLYQRYVGKLGKQEDQLETSQQALDNAIRQQQRRRRALSDAISNMKL